MTVSTRPKTHRLIRQRLPLRLRLRHVSLAGALAMACAGSFGCSSPSQANEGGVLLAQATGVVEAEQGPLLTMTAGKKVGAIPDAPVIRLAIGRDVHWWVVDSVLKRIEKAGKRYSLLVGKRRKTRGFVLSETIEGESIQLTATDRGKACVSPPGVAEAKCVQRRDKKHISRAFTRELTREAVKGYRLHAVKVHLPRAITWADVVRVVDGARTCCAKSRTPIRVHVIR